MASDIRKVSRKYAKNEFKTVGLVFIIYALFVLFVPLLIKILEPLLNEHTIFGYSIYSLSHVVCIFFGTIIPFFILKISRKKKKDNSIKIRPTIFEYVVNYFVFFGAAAIAIFTTMMISQYFNIGGELVSSIGLVLNSDYLNDNLYILSFILLTPIIEEFAFRGVLLNFLSKYGKYFAVVCSSLMYALAHGSFVEMIPAYIMGRVLSKMALRYKSVKPVIIIHILFNATIYFLLLIPESYSLYMSIGLAAFLLIAGFLLFGKIYHFMTLRKSESSYEVIGLFLSTFTVAFSIALFIIHSITQLFI